MGKGTFPLPPPSSRDDPRALRIRCDVQGDRRHGGFTTGWRSLPLTVVEFSPDGRWRIQTEGGMDITVPPGEAFFVPAGVRHCLTVPPGVRDMDTTWAYLAVAQGPGEDQLWGAQGGPGLGHADGRRVATLLPRLRNEIATLPGLAEVARRQRLALELLELLLAHCVPISRPSPHERARIRPALDYIESHLARPVSRHDLARTLSLSPTRFHAVFAQAMGIAPCRYLLQRRITAAQELLMATDLRIAEIATRTGFSSAFYFSRCFRQVVGQPPAAFRRGLQRPSP